MKWVYYMRVGLKHNHDKIVNVHNLFYNFTKETLLFVATCNFYCNVYIINSQLK